MFLQTFKCILRTGRVISAYRRKQRRYCILIHLNKSGKKLYYTYFRSFYNITLHSIRIQEKTNLLSLINSSSASAVRYIHQIPETKEALCQNRNPAGTSFGGTLLLISAALYSVVQQFHNAAEKYRQNGCAVTHLARRTALRRCNYNIFLFLIGSVSVQHRKDALL